MAFDFPSSPTVGQQFSPVPGTTYVWNGYAWSLALGGPAVLTTKLIPLLSGSGTYVPSPGTVGIIVEMCGGGAAGTEGAASVNVGSGGGATTFGSLTATGGAAASNYFTSGAGGTATGGDINLQGGRGTGGSNYNTVSAPGGSGGTNPFGGAGAGIAGTPGTAGAPNTGAGGGGGGVTGAGQLGGTGGSAGGYLLKALSPVAASYSYAIGAGGAGAGTIPGGSGGSGVILVTEFIAVSAAIVAPAPGALVQIQRQVISSPVGVIDFTTGISATYEEYEIHFFGLETAVDGNLTMIISQDGGATWKQGSTDYSWENVFIPNPSSSAAFNASSSPAMVMGQHNASTTNRAAGIIKFYLPAATTFRKAFLWDIYHIPGVFASTRGSGAYAADNNAINGIRLYNGAGLLNNGTFILYGRAK
jgi:hypothetical protein